MLSIKRITLTAILLLSLLPQSQTALAQTGPSNQIRLPAVLRNSAPVLPRDGCVITRSTATTPTYPTTHPRILLSHASTKSCLQQLLAAAKQQADEPDEVRNLEKQVAETKAELEKFK